MGRQAIIDEAVRLAIIQANQKGLVIGQVVAHRSESRTGELVRVEEETAVVGWRAEWTSDGLAKEKTFPLCELFDPNTASDIALNIYSEAVTQQFSN